MVGEGGEYRFEYILVHPFISQRFHDIPVKRRLACPWTSAENDQFAWMLAREYRRVIVGASM